MSSQPVFLVLPTSSSASARTPTTDGSHARDAAHEQQADTSSPSARERILAQLARSEIQARERRGRIFKSTLFSDPAWDILLDCFAANFDGQRRSITSVALFAEIPPTTALRWIAVLENERLIERVPDPLDARRTFIQLTSDGLRSMAGYFGVHI